MAHGCILIVDDDDAIRLTLQDILEDEGHLVALAADGEEALAYLGAAESPPCLILLDLWMPRMDGMEFRKHQLAKQEWSVIPVVVISAANDGRARATALAANAYLGK